ncbi:polysialyltransferase family glycosyltransferase [Hydrogenovibrio halophilus]|uniref:polysialyltransferase family glycosyltransferase n=1 Tax=Hydrogenovibrio halophilus TaxID=373391 RepID=UPI0009FD5AC0|nr:polysialyltransferase family glycosyltransferase [Hydrogenovibrio halophilus]
MNHSCLYLPSTPLNMLVSVALAVHQRQSMPETHSALWLIDQANTRANPYYESLLAWEDAPFDSVQILPGLVKNGVGRGKLAERRQNFLQIDQWLSQFQAQNGLPHVVATGSDRRVEFQYVMHRITQQAARPQGWYLDDGLYSYAGRPHHWFKDGVNALLKKLVYGFWWQEPQTVGASDWIDQAWLFRPKAAVKPLQQKTTQALSEDLFLAPPVQTFCGALMEKHGVDQASMQTVQTLVLIPHPNNQKKIRGYAQQVQALVKRLVDAGEQVAVKYHPRQAGQDALGLMSDANVMVLPSNLAFEMLLPALPENARIIGDVGTALLTAKWLRPDLTSYALLNEEDAFSRQFIPLMQTMGVKTVGAIQDL